MPAKFIKNNDNSFLCNICSENIEVNNAIGLKCNPTKHIFCYECILDWYKELNKNRNTHNYSIRNMCPICRKNGGSLPINEKFKTIKGIHDIKKDEEIIHIKLPHECGAKLKTKDGYCKSTGRQCYNGFCGKHSTAGIVGKVSTVDTVGTLII